MMGRKGDLLKALFRRPGNNSPTPDQPESSQLSNHSQAIIDSHTYQYKPLCGDDSIRLLDLKPATSNHAPIHCNLTEVTLSLENEYEALSYVWGKDEFPKTLNLPSGHLKITENLAAALKNLRLTDKSRMLWVDAACINQSDDVEKGLQVARMASIYRNAFGVLAWLGEASETAPLGKQAIITLSQEAKDIGLGESVEGQRDILMAWLRADCTAFDKAMELSKTAKSANFPLIYGNPWFTRMWIVQEALLAGHITLCYGSNTLSWEDFERVMILIHALKEAIRISMPDVDSFNRHAWNLVIVRDHYHRSSEREENQRLDFAYYMNQLRDRDCKDDRDRFFALKGLLPESSDLVIVPDYKKTIVQVYTELAKQQLQQGRIEVLFGAGLCRSVVDVFPGVLLNPSFTIPESLPTWVPDYRKHTTFVGWTPYFGTASSFLPDLTMPSTIAFSPNNPQRLVTHGTLIDIIIFTLPPSLRL